MDCGNMGRIWTVKFACIAACMISGAAGRLTVLPQNCAVMKGQQVIMECETDVSERRLRWERNLLAFDKEAEKIVFNGYDISPYAAPYCQLITGFDGKYDIQINASSEKAAQRYKCLEPVTLENGSAELVVLHSNPVCNDSSNNDYINATCTIPFSGNWRPQMFWALNGQDFLENVVTEVKNQSLTSSLVLPRNSTSYSISCKTNFTSHFRPSVTTAKNVPTYSNVWSSTGPATASPSLTTNVKIVIAVCCTLPVFLLFGIFLNRRHKEKVRLNNNNKRGQGTQSLCTSLKLAKMSIPNEVVEEQVDPLISLS